MLKLCCRFLAQPAETLQLESFEGQSGPLGFSGTLPCLDAKLTEPSQVRNLEPEALGAKGGHPLETRKAARSSLNLNR